MRTKARGVGGKSASVGRRRKAATPGGPAGSPRSHARPRPTSWEDVTARDIMRRSVVTVAADDSLAEVERILADHKVGGAAVVDGSGRLVGVVSLRDLVEERSSEDAARPRRQRASDFYGLTSDERIEEDLESFEVPADVEDTAADVMTAEVLSVSADAGLAEIARVMTKHRVHRLLVTDARKYVGLVGTWEVLAALAR